MNKPAVRLQEVVFDCHDIHRVATFWSALLGARAAVVSDDWAVVDCGAIRLGFQRVPEPKSSPKNRLHLDLEVADLHDAKAYAESLGAVTVSEVEESEDGTGGVILRDVEGNEFCLVRDLQGTYLRKVKAALEL